ALYQLPSPPERLPARPDSPSQEARKAPGEDAGPLSSEDFRPPASAFWLFFPGKTRISVQETWKNRLFSLKNVREVLPFSQSRLLSLGPNQKETQWLPSFPSRNSLSALPRLPNCPSVTSRTSWII